MKYKTFDDLVFYKKGGDPCVAHTMMVMVKDYIYPDAIRASIEFDNGYGVSVIAGGMARGHRSAPYELAIFKGDELDYDHPESDGDVRGHLTPDEVTEIMRRVQDTEKVE